MHFLCTGYSWPGVFSCRPLSLCCSLKHHWASIASDGVSEEGQPGSNWPQQSPASCLICWGTENWGCCLHIWAGVRACQFFPLGLMFLLPPSSCSHSQVLVYIPGLLKVPAAWGHRCFCLLEPMDGCIRAATDVMVLLKLHFCL